MCSHGCWACMTRAFLGGLGSSRRDRPPVARTSCLQGLRAARPRCLALEPLAQQLSPRLRQGQGDRGWSTSAGPSWKVQSRHAPRTGLADHGDPGGVAFDSHRLGCAGSKVGLPRSARVLAVGDRGLIAFDAHVGPRGVISPYSPDPSARCCRAVDEM
ncbi:hypothetical protein A8926_6881 [Saccharopolyspora spinosa]|uniref:Uncharacterized protein n=1 Tax=Saccharopolyspora spinosa TaxID=60894 RepID=A0A2N3Y798_SACSN|nr:hypothetical protein A8926_6881 [Saccharopolyspora spinosa]